MLTKLHIANFRGIVKDTIDLGKINILTGANNSGKSSIMYGLLALKNVVGNSNQSLDSCLTLPYMNLGGFSQIVYNKDDNKTIVLGIEVTEDKFNSTYVVELGKKKSELTLHSSIMPGVQRLKLEVSFPYPANSTTGIEIKNDLGIAKITWNGISPTINFVKSGDADDTKVKDYTDLLSNSLNAPVEALRTVDFVPLRRGFTKPVYTSVTMQPQLISEDEVASLLAADRDLEGEVAHYLEKIVDRVFNIRNTIGTGNFNLQTRNRNTGFVADLVNEGFGTNQLVSILTKALKKDVKVLCIEESEIHLHPSIMAKFIEVLIEIATEKNKQFILSTHSEHIVMSLLNKVAVKKILPDDIKIYYLQQSRKQTKIENQEVNDKGQIKGGLKSFYETELNEIKEFFSISE